MPGADEERAKQPVTKKKSVQIVDNRPEVVEVREKHGSLYNAIPRMPVGVAILCCLFNIILPGFGTLISAFTVLCGAPTNTDTRVNAFCLNLLSAFLQMITFIIIVGWVWSILWGMNMVTLATNWGEDTKKSSSYYCRRQSSMEGI